MVCRLNIRIYQKFLIFPKISNVFYQRCLKNSTNILNFIIFLICSESGKQPSLFVSMGLGMCAGIAGSFVGNPAEISLIRMTADGRLPVEQRRNYTSVVNALTRIVREEGVLTCWRGCIPTMGRAAVVNAAQLSSYSQAKQALLKHFGFSENLWLHFTASMFSGFVTTAASMPVDIAKTRIQNMKVDASGKGEYKGTFDVLAKVCKHEGVFALWKGFWPYYFRLGPHTVITFILMEQLNSFYSRYVLGDHNAKSSF